MYFKAIFLQLCLLKLEQACILSYVEVRIKKIIEFPLFKKVGLYNQNCY